MAAINKVGVFIDAIIIIIAGCSMLQVNWRKHFSRIIIIAGYCGILILTIKGSLHPLIYTTIVLLSLTILFKFMMNVSFLLSLSIVFVGSTLLLLGEATIVPLFQYFVGNHTPSVPKQLLVWSFILVFVYLVNKFGLNIQIPERFKTKKDSLLPVISFTITTSAIYFSIFSIFYEKDFGIKGEEGFWLLGLVILIKLVIYLTKQRYKGKIESVEMAINQQYDEDLGQYVDIIKMQKNETVKHLMKIRMLLHVGDLQSSRKYIDDVIDETSRIHGIFPIESDTISGMLLAYKEQANQRHTDICYRIYDDLTRLPCKTYEVNKLLGNIINNAIEAVEQLPEEKRNIDFKVKNCKESIRFEISHSIIRDLFPNNHSITVTKPNGLTIQNPYVKTKFEIAQSILMKYGGKMMINWFNDSRRFTIEIPVKE